MAAILITSQSYLDDEIVAAKSEAADYTVSVSPEFEIDGVMYRCIIDGNHSMAAANQDAVEPELIEATMQDADYLSYLIDGNIEMFLQVLPGDGDFINAATRRPVW